MDMGYPQKGHVTSGSIMRWRCEQSENITCPHPWVQAVKINSNKALPKGQKSRLPVPAHHRVTCVVVSPLHFEKKKNLLVIIQ